MTKRIELITPSLIEIGNWIEDNAANGYKLRKDYPQLLGYQYYAEMEQAEEQPEQDDKPARKPRTTKAA